MIDEKENFVSNTPQQTAANKFLNAVRELRKQGFSEDDEEAINALQSGEYKLKIRTKRDIAAFRRFVEANKAITDEPLDEEFYELLSEVSIRGVELE